MPFLRVIIPSLLSLQLGMIALLFIATVLFGQNFQGRNEFILSVFGMFMAFLITLFALFFVRRNTVNAYIVSGLTAAPIVTYALLQIVFPIWLVLNSSVK